MKEMEIKDAKSRITTFLELEGYQWKEEKDIPEGAQFVLSFIDSLTNLVILIIQHFSHRIDIVSNVQLSREHEEKYLSLPESDRQKLLSEIFMWVTPREPKLLFHFTGNSGDNGYTIVSHVYADEFSMGNFMSAVNKVTKSSVIARQIIQSRLGVELNE